MDVTRPIFYTVEEKGLMRRDKVDCPSLAPFRSILRITYAMASQHVYPSVSLIVPTYHEAENIEPLIERVGQLREDPGLKLELLIMDDNSQDGTVEIVESLQLAWVRLVVRTKDRGLSQAVIEGMQLADHDVIVITDADLSYDPKTIPQLLLLLSQGYDYVIGSRYIENASDAPDRGFFRWLNSKIATLLARPFTSLKDPMSGHIAFRRSALENAPPLRPIGYKIGLELIVKCGFSRTAELPVDYVDRQRGQSKLSLREQWLYCRHIARLFVYKYLTRN